LLNIFPLFRAGRNDDFDVSIRTRKSAPLRFFSLPVDRGALPPHRRALKKKNRRDWGAPVFEAKTPKLRIVRPSRVEPAGAGPERVEGRWRDRPSYSATYAREWRDVCAFLRARFGPGPPDPEDVAQQAFFKLGELEGAERLESPRAFVFRVAINLMLDERRGLARASRNLDASAPLLAIDAEEAPDLERSLIAKQQMGLLEKVVQGLPERHRQYLLANRLEGQSFVAIAERFGVSQSLVRKTVEEALAVCQRALIHGTADYRGLSRERSRRS
jgi:RNA polymerase sigma-70 factor (ECF subfamily)